MTNFEKEIFIMAKNRSIKVVSQSGYNYKATPTITLKGQWLKDLACLKEIMGHSEFRETLVYAHVLSETKIEGVSTAFAGFSF